ncbi:MAG: MBL fold metallo-hydrolase [Thermoprotei archaeon]|nr:MAG: MBL fold metallo-hydrolase [Thermoprotei archaeon]
MLRFEPVWADSLGAKSFCTLVETPDARILIDPGVAIMHPTFPASYEDKVRWVEEGYGRVVAAAARADVVVITHYHYDHFTDFDERLYRGKLILAKSPNEYINDSQRARAMRFYERLFSMAGVELREVLEEPVERDYPNPLEELRHALSLDYGDYWGRKRELLEKGLKWFGGRVSKWNSYERIPELERGSLRLLFADGRELEVGGTRLRFTKPMFHGVEFSRVGWVVGLVVEHGGEKLLYSSDLNGPIIEDYADWIIGERPRVLLLDGPATYTLGYMLNRLNLRRAVENLKRIVLEAAPELVLLDHHLPREPRFRERLREVYEVAEREGVRVVTVAEYLGREPACLAAGR